MAEFNVQLRLPSQIEKGAIIEVKIKIQHPSTTGLQLVEDAKTQYERFVRNQPAAFIKTVDVFYGADKISTFDINSASSDNPLLSFKLKASQEAPLRVAVTNYQNTTAEATSDVRFS